MTYYTENNWSLVPQSITETEGGAWRSLGSDFSNAFREGVASSIYRSLQARNAVEDETSPMMSKEAADEILKEYKITNITIPQEGVTTAYMDLLKEQTKSRIEREQFAQRAPNYIGSGTASFIASLAGGMADPANVALMFIPVVGEARAASLLGRTAQRFGQGALAGAAQASLTQPLVTQAAAVEGESYSNLQAMTNIAFSTLAGGAIVSLGGAVGEGIGRIRAYRASRNKVSDPEVTNPSLDNQVETMPLENYNSHVVDYHKLIAEDTAYNETIGSSIFDLEYSATRQLTGAQQKAVRAEINDIGYQLRDENINKRYRELINEYHTDAVSGRKAKAKADKEIESYKRDLNNRLDDLHEQLENHKLANQAIYDLNEIKKGRIPDRLKKDFESRKQAILENIKDNETPQQTAIEKINDADFIIKNNALRASVAQAMEGKQLDVAPFFDLVDPSKKQEAIRKLADNNIKLDDETINLINQVDSDLKNASNTDDFKKLVDDINYLHELTAKKAEQSGQPEVKAALDEAIKFANDDTISDASRAYALCRIGK